MKRILLAMVTLWALGAGQQAHAAPITIFYDAIDLVDQTSGADLWQYRYFVDGTFDENQGFSVFFDVGLFEALDAEPVTNAGWDVLTFEPDPLLPSDGLYDALALTAGPSLTNAFVVNFLWLGAVGSAPGAQPFMVNQWASDGVTWLASLQDGMTTPLAQPVPVPEPSTLLLMSSAVAGLALRRRRRRRL